MELSESPKSPKLAIENRQVRRLSRDLFFALPTLEFGRRE